MKLPLQARVVLLIGGSLVVLQLTLAWMFTSALDESEALRRSTLQAAANTALEQAVADHVRQQSDRLRLTAGLAREQAAETILVYENDAPEERGFFAKLFGGKAEQPEQATEETRRLSERIADIREYRDEQPTLWLLKTADADVLAPQLRARARTLPGEDDRPAAQLLCEAADCSLMSALQFRTTDGVQIVAVAIARLSDILATLEQTGGYTMVMQADAAAPGTTRFDELASVAVNPAPLSLAFTGSRDGARLQTLRRQYLTLAFWGVVVSVLLLALLMRGVIRRISTLSDALPKLTMGRFDEARQTLHKHQDAGLTRDETHDLLKVAESVTVQLADMRGNLLRQAEALRGERDHVRLLLDTVPACVVLLDQDTTVRSCNRLMGELLGQPSEQLHAQPLLPLVAKGDQAAFARAVKQARAERSQIETTLHAADDDALRLHWHLVAMADGQVLAIGLDVTNLRAAQHKLQWQADHDPQTGLLNRRTLGKRIRAADQHCTIALIAPSAGEHYNDTLDDNELAMLRAEVAERLRSLAPSHARVELARLRDLNFAALIHAPRDAVQQALEDQFRQLCDVETRIHSKPIHLHFQLIGIDWPTGQHKDLAPQVLRSTSSLLAGSDACIWPDSASVIAACQSDFRHWVQRIDAALTGDGLQLVYQPIFNTKTLQPSHSEGLVRMRDADGSLLSPGLFLPHAEQSGQVPLIERVVLDQAIECALQLQANDQAHVLSVNIAARSLRDDGLYKRITDAVESRGLEPDRLMLEILESQAIEDVATAAALMHRFKDLGVGIALDDFGIGFTSFEYLRELPFDYVKIDKLFVRQLSSKPDDQRLIRAIHDIASGMGRKTVAEGVEDAQSLVILRDIGIDAVQGYLLAGMHDAPCLDAVKLEA